MIVNDIDFVSESYDRGLRIDGAIRSRRESRYFNSAPPPVTSPLVCRCCGRAVESLGDSRACEPCEAEEAETLAARDRADIKTGYRLAKMDEYDGYP